MAFNLKEGVTPETDERGRIKRPMRVALFNSGAFLVAGGIAMAAVMLRYRQLLANAAWEFIVIALAGLIFLIFAHAYLGAWIGLKRADFILILLWGVILIGGILILRHYTLKD